LEALRRRSGSAVGDRQVSSGHNRSGERVYARADALRSPAVRLHHVAISVKPGLVGKKLVELGQTSDL
jgi:hypothetical protein